MKYQIYKLLWGAHTQPMLDANGIIRPAYYRAQRRIPVITGSEQMKLDPTDTTFNDMVPGLDFLSAGAVMNTPFKGEPVPCDLAKTFEGKFAALDQKQEHTYQGLRASTGAGANAVSTPSSKAAASETSPMTGAPPPSIPEGKDRTKDFPEADENDYKVYKVSATEWFVYNGDDLSAPVNLEPLAGKPAVKALLDKILKKQSVRV